MRMRESVERWTQMDTNATQVRVQVNGQLKHPQERERKLRKRADWTVDSEKEGRIEGTVPGRHR